MHLCLRRRRRYPLSDVVNHRFRNEAGRRAPYVFLDPGSVGMAAVLLNVCVLGGCGLVVGSTLLAVNRLATPARIDAV
jgi:hypothetical protein